MNILNKKTQLSNWNNDKWNCLNDLENLKKKAKSNFDIFMDN